MPKLTGTLAAAWRIRRHHLGQRAPSGSLLAVAGRLCGLPAQVMSSAAGLTPIVSGNRVPQYPTNNRKNFAAGQSGVPLKLLA